MIWSININQYQAVKLGLKNAQHAIILGLICDAATWAEAIIIDNEVFYWTAKHKIADELPLLDLKPDSVYRVFRSLDKLGLIVYRKSGVKDCTRLTTLGKKYYVGKKSVSEKNSKKTPGKLGKKSENGSEKYPTYTSTISYPTTNHQEDEEESVAPCVEVIPEALIHLSSSELENAIVYAIKKFARKSPVGYRRKLEEGIKNGDLGWISMILECHKISKKPFFLSLEDQKQLNRLKGEVNTLMTIMTYRGHSKSEIINEIKGMILSKSHLFENQEAMASFAENCFSCIRDAE